MQMDRYEKAIERYMNTLERYNPTRVTSKFITCRDCGSKLNVEAMKKKYTSCIRLKCVVCGSSAGLYSNTANKAIEAAYANRDKVKAATMADASKTVKKSQDLSISQTAFESALRDTRDRFDYVLEEHKTPDFTEIVGSIGGDIITNRVYKDGSVYEQ